MSNFPTTSATPPPIPTSTSSNIITGTFALVIEATLIARLILDNSPPEATFWIGLGSALGTTPAISIDENLLVTVEDDVKVDGRAVGHVTTDNDGDFDLAVGNDFKCTSGGNLALTFTNAAAGQSGNIMFVNGSNHTITAAATVAINADVLTTISASGTYHLSYFCSAASGNDTILVSASAILT